MHTSLHRQRWCSAAARACALLTAAGCLADPAETKPPPEATLLATRDLKIGSAVDAAAAFSWFRELEVGSDGRIYTAHPQEQRIRVHSPSGRLLATIGRVGEGPGEFRNLGPMALRHDTLWVLDLGTYRFSYFDADGALLRSQRIPIDFGRAAGARPPRPQGLLPDGSIWGAPRARSRVVATDSITEQIVLRMDGAGSVVDTLATYSLRHTVWMLSDPEDPTRFAGFRPQPFSDAELVDSRVGYGAPLQRRNRATAANAPAMAMMMPTENPSDHFSSSENR